MIATSDYIFILKWIFILEKGDKFVILSLPSQNGGYTKQFNHLKNEVNVVPKEQGGSVSVR